MKKKLRPLIHFFGEAEWDFISKLLWFPILNLANLSPDRLTGEMLCKVKWQT